MNHARYYHGCAFVPSTEKSEDQVVVVGGFQGGPTVESLSTNNEKVWRPKENVPLPGLVWHAVTNAISPNYLLFTVGDGFSGAGSGAIYGLTHSNKWELVGNLRSKRYFHTSLNLPRKDIPDCV